MKLTNCSMGCAYATGGLDKCQCICGGKTHGMFAGIPVAAKCSPAVEKRCKAGNEDGACSCACGGVNHGLYREIDDFSKIKITTYGTDPVLQSGARTA